MMAGAVAIASAQGFPGVASVPPVSPSSILLGRAEYMENELPHCAVSRCRQASRITSS